MGRPSEFPLVIRSGSATVKIYHVLNRGSDIYMLSYWAQGKRHRPSFADLEEATRAARKIADKMAAGTFTATSLSPAAEASYSRALELLPKGVSLEMAVAQFAEASKILAGRSVIESARFYVQRHPSDVPRKTFSEVVEELISAKQKDGLSYLAINDLKKLRIPAKDFSMQISDVCGTQLDQWLRQRELAPRTRNNYRDLFRTLFNFAKARKYLPFDHNEIASVSTAKEAGSEIEIYTPAELQLIFSYARPREIPFLALAAFAGIRHWEITRLDWTDIKFDTGLIEMKRGKTKTRFRRLVPIPKNLRRWLEPYAQKFGPVCTYKNMNDALTLLTERVAEDHKFEWKHNALRHSFISYRLAIVKDENQVALESGNSPKVIFESYRALVSEKDAKKWFAISPVKQEKIVHLSAVPRLSSGG